MDENTNEDFTLSLSRKEMVMVDFALRLWSKQTFASEETRERASVLAGYIRRTLGKAN